MLQSMLAYLVMPGLAYAGYLAGKALWVRSVGAGWMILPAFLSYLAAVWLVLAASILTQGVVLILAIVVWAGLWVGKVLARRSAKRES